MFELTCLGVKTDMQCIQDNKEILPLLRFAQLPRHHIASRGRNREALLLESGLALDLLDVFALLDLLHAAHPFGYLLQFIGALQDSCRIAYL